MGNEIVVFNGKIILLNDNLGSRNILIFYFKKVDNGVLIKLNIKYKY